MKIVDADTMEVNHLIRRAFIASIRGWALTSLLGTVLLEAGPLTAEPITVRYREGSIHGFLALRTLEGKILAAGDFTQTVRGNRLVSRLVFRFKDGSVHDENVVFSQQHSFRLISYRHIQKGPSSLSHWTFPLTPLPGRSRSVTQMTARERSKRNVWTFRPIWQMAWS